MPYWKCPRCGSSDAYSGAELAIQQSQGSSAVVVSDEFAVAQHQQGQVNVATIDVVKCRNCNTLLNGKRDYLYTVEEQREIIAKEQEDIKNKKRRARDLGIAGSIATTTITAVLSLANGASLIVGSLGSVLCGGILGFLVWILAMPNNSTTTFRPTS